MAEARSTDFSWHIRAQDSIAHAALTNSKRPQSFVMGVYPTHLSKGEGAFVYDTSGKKYLDFICGLGSCILGYAHPAITARVSDQCRKGFVLSLGTPLEVETAEKVKELIPFIQKLRFLKTGTDACTAATRIARAATGRNIILSEGYHGWSDEYVSLTPPALGVPPQTSIHKFTGLNQINRSVAAVIVEPIITDCTQERIIFLRNLREVCDLNGTLLIFDEVITGLRHPTYSASNFYGITPDLICLGKSMANGLPLSVVGGKTSVMECGEYFISSTFAGETLSLAAAHETMRLLQTKYSLHELWDAGLRFITKFNSIWPEGIHIEGYPTRGVFKGEPLAKALFMQEACLSRILVGPSFFFNFAHIGVADIALKTFEDILLRIKGGGITLKGEMPQSPFAQKVREQS